MTHRGFGKVVPSWNVLKSYASYGECAKVASPRPVGDIKAEAR